MMEGKAMGEMLEFDDVVVSFTANAGLVARMQGRTASFNAVDHVKLSVARGEILGIVGESGSGKTTICKAALGLHSIAAGAVTLDGKVASLRDGTMQMVFQDPLSSLNPRQTIAEAISIPLRLHGLAGRGNVEERIDALLKDVGLGAQFRNRFPHELSGGQLQRAAIARALATKPMYFGKLLEFGPTRDVYANPKHPYTQELLGTLDLERKTVASTRDIFNPLTDDTSACRYLNRCPHAMPACAERHPEFRTTGQGHRTACYLYDEASQ
jgi:oligopeptide/dipeptide ABC transporter ATP-binding protein